MKKSSLILAFLLSFIFCNAAFALTDLDLVLNGNFANTDAWTEEGDYTITGGVCNWESTGNDNGHVLSQTISVVEDYVYKVAFTVSSTSFTNPDTYVAIQVGGGTSKHITQDGTYEIYLVGGNSPSSGLEITAVNDTSGDTMTLDNISVKPQHFSASTNLDNVFVSGNLRVPAGADVVTAGDFEGAVEVFWTTGTGWSIGSGVASCDGTQETDSSLTASAAGANPLTAGREYLVKYTVTRTAGSVVVVVGTGEGTERITSDTFSEALVANGASLSIKADYAFVGTIDDIKVYELTEGPMDNYVASGTQGGQVKYTSVSTHADGAGGAAQEWDLWWDGSTDWIISLVAGTKGTNYWSRTNASQIGAYAVNGNVIGTGTGSYGTKDHSIPVLSGQQGFKTDGSTGSLDLRTRQDYLNDLRDGKFAIVSCFNVDSETDDRARIYSIETSNNVSLFWQRFTSPNTVLAQWNGTVSLSSDILALQENEIHNSANIVNVDATSGWFTLDGVLRDTDTSFSGLVVGQSSHIRLGCKAYDITGFSKVSLGFTAILDLTSVTTLNATWSTGLSTAINNAARRYAYDPTKIAQAIYAYDNNIAGVYYALNEAPIGDASSYYLLAYDITDDSAKTSEFYGLVSESGVTGEIISIPKGYRRRYKYDAGPRILRSRYNNN